MIEPTDARCETQPLSEACPAAPPTVGEECSDVAIDCWYPEGAHSLQWNQRTCPVCAAPTTLTATPAGEREIALLASVTGFTV